METLMEPHTSESLMETHIERRSNDKKRPLQEVIAIEPPSPMKRQARQPPSESPIQLPFSLVDELYNLDLDLNGDVGYVEDGSVKPKERNSSVPVKPSDPALRYWTEHHRDEYLYANMDYIFASILRHLHRLLRIILSYDIACQWWKDLKACLLLLPPLVRLQLALEFIRVVVPKMHTPECQHKYSLNLVPGSGQTDAEGIERAWAMKYWGLQQPSDAVSEVKLERQKAAFKHFSEEQADSVDEWADLVEAYEADGTKKNPHKPTMKGLSEAQVRSQLEEAEAVAEAKAAQVRIHEVGPVAFVVLGLEAEEEQRAIRVQVVLKKAKSTTAKGQLRGMRKRLNRKMEQLCSLQATYTPAALIRLNALVLAEDVLPENIPLLLPSALMAPPPARRAAHGRADRAFLEVLGIEHQLRGPQCRTALVQPQPTTYQGATAALQEKPLTTPRDEYEMAWLALVLIAGGLDADIGWKKLEKADIRCMQEAETLRKQAQRERRERNQREREARLIVENELPAPKENDDEDMEDASDGERFTEGQNRGIMRVRTPPKVLAKLINAAALRVEWCNAWALVRWWDEEVRILKEEQRRLPISLRHEADEWKARAQLVKSQRRRQKE
ncbi:hypothetical protein HMN09_00484000 [Mycena chlorophos]|uniref:Uncharacterized protein n=1 Tax=Mycena chlorophos TaxID=658473 RepID=A0A8H6TGW8_MYCCL|nr:hypothetical protein HMN09_00484000 [Mycena chlorophos]